jgi:hypothetical protein
VGPTTSCQHPIIREHERGAGRRAGTMGSSVGSGCEQSKPARDARPPVCRLRLGLGASRCWAVAAEMGRNKARPDAGTRQQDAHALNGHARGKMRGGRENEGQPSSAPASTPSYAWRWARTPGEALGARRQALGAVSRRTLQNNVSPPHLSMLSPTHAQA